MFLSCFFGKNRYNNKGRNGSIGKDIINGKITETDCKKWLLFA